LGAGLMGPVIARNLAESREVSSVTICDLDKNRLLRAQEWIANEKLATKELNVSDEKAAAKAFEGFDVLCIALPPHLSIPANRAAMDAGINAVDLWFDAAMFDLDEALRERGVSLIPGCGVAPGLTNILAGNAANKLDAVDDIHLLVGGLPVKPEPPLEYKVVFSLEGVWEEYTVKCPIYRDGKLMEAEALDGLETVEFPEPFGKMEAFYTAGLATLLYTMKGRVKNMHEKTIRWPGHAEKIRLLRSMGFIGRETIEVDGFKVEPRRFTSALLSPLLHLDTTKERDVTLLRVTVSGVKENARVTYTYDMIDYFDEVAGVTSMAKTTANTCAEVAKMVGRNEIKGVGLLAPESVLVGSLFDKLMMGLSARGVRISEKVTTTKLLGST
jgi:lysine 6-dehydrogenase